MTITAHPIEANRLFAEDARRQRQAEAERMERQRRILAKHEPKRRIAPQSWVFALNGIAGLLFIATGALAYAGLLAGL